MADEILFDYKAIGDAQLSLRAGRGKLAELGTALQQITKSLDDGALQGQAGQALSDGINTKLVKAVQLLDARLDEVDRDVTKAVDLMQQTDKSEKFD